MALIKCTKCGADISDKAAACPNCGAPVIKLMKCSECGTELPIGATECPNCGCPVEAPAPQVYRTNKYAPETKEKDLSEAVKKRVQYFLVNNKKYLPESYIPQLRERLLTLDKEQLSNIECVQFKDPTMMLIISIFLGYLGIDRFMLGNIGWAILKLLLLLVCGIGLIWWLIDLFLVMDNTKNYNYKRLEDIFSFLDEE